MKKTCFLIVVAGVALYSPPAFSDSIVNIGIKSKMSNHVLSNCRFASALALSTDTENVVIASGDTRHAKTVGLRQTPTELPNTDRASKVEFHDSAMKALFAPNVKYSSANSGRYPAVLFKDWSVTEFVDTHAWSYGYRGGMTLFSTLPQGKNAAAIHSQGELNFSYRMKDGQGELECDIYDKTDNDDKGNLLGLVDYVTDSSQGTYTTLAYGENNAEKARNGEILKKISMDAQIAKNYGGSYPKKRILLTMSDLHASAQGTGADKDPDGTPDTGPAPAAPARTAGAQNQSTVSNMTKNYTLRDCEKHDTHGSWINSPSPADVIGPDTYFTFTMKSKGHGIQGEIRCVIQYKTKTKDPVEIAMGRLLIEIDNDGTAFAVFPFINDEATAAQLVAGGFQYTLWVTVNDNYSITLNEGR
jgi:hypothetical protein